MSTENYFLYFDTGVLARYRADSHRYEIKEDQVEAEIGSNQEPWWRVRYGWRRLKNGTRVIAAYKDDIHDLPDEEKRRWQADVKRNLTFLDNDPEWDAWLHRVVGGGAFDKNNYPRKLINEEVKKVRAISGVVVGIPLFKNEFDVGLVNKPISENTDSFYNAVLELYRLLVDGLESRSLEALSKHLSVTVSEQGTLNKLKDLLPTALHESIHSPLKKVARIRNKKHGIPSQGVSKAHSATEEYDALLKELANGFKELREWLERTFEVNSEACIERIRTIQNLPQISSHPDIFLIETLPQERLKGKVVEKMQIGDVPQEALPDSEAKKWRSQAAIIHFTDGSKFVLEIGSNFSNSASPATLVSTEGFSNTLIPTYIPKPDDEK